MRPREPVPPSPPAATDRLEEPGSLNLLAIPRSDVYLEGRLLGRTPLFERVVPAGSHTLELRPVGGGAPERITVQIRPGRNTSTAVRLGEAARGAPDAE